MEPMKPMAPMKPMKRSDPWWPQELGQPSTSGGQNDMRYAFFPDKHRLLIEQDGKLTTYDSGDHKISGDSQSSRRSPTLSSQNGDVAVDDLTIVG